jgi:hypothetical protein
MVADEILKRVKDGLKGPLGERGIVLFEYRTTHKRDWLVFREEDERLLPLRTIVSDRDHASGWWGITKSVIDQLYADKAWIVALALDDASGMLMTGKQFLKHARFYENSESYSLWGDMADAGRRYDSLERLADLIAGHLDRNKAVPSLLPNT